MGTNTLVSECRTRLHPIVRDLGLTLATESSIVVAGLLLVSLVGRLLGPVALGEYLLLRRVSGWLIAGVLLGLGQGLPRYVALAMTKPLRERLAYFAASTSCIMGSAIAVALVLWFGRQFFASLLFGDSRLSNLILPLALMLLGLSAQSAVYGYHRGILSMVRANALQICDMAIFPTAAVILLYRLHSVAWIVGATGCLTALGAAWFARPVARQLRRSGSPPIAPYASELLRYGIGRVPGDFGLNALLALSPVIASHYLPLSRVSFLLLGLNVLLVVGYAGGPLGLVLLSKLSMMIGENRLEDVRERLRLLVAAVLEISVFACLQLIVFADVLVRVWVGAKFLDATSIIRLLILAVPPYLFYVALRASIDAVTAKPCNAGNILAALAVYLVLVGVTVKALPANFLLEGLAGSLVVALALLGVLTARTFRQLYDLSIPWRDCAPSIVAGLALGGLSFGFRRIQGFHEGVVMALAFGALMSGLFLVLLIKLRSPWLEFVRKMAFPRQGLGRGYSSPAERARFQGAAKAADGSL
jgi:O-antigen/teichoic acid export membrane protein